MQLFYLFSDCYKSACLAESCRSVGYASCSCGSRTPGTACTAAPCSSWSYSGPASSCQLTNSHKVYISSFKGFLYFSKILFVKWPLKAFHNDDILFYKFNMRLIMMKVVYIHKMIVYFS